MSSRYHPELDGLRGVLIAGIVAFHAYQFAAPGIGAFPELVLRNLDFGVAWFFVLSGFLLYRPMVGAAAAAAQQPSWRRYLARRAARLLPVYVVAVTLVWALRNPYLPGDWRDLVEHLTFMQVFDRQRIFSTIGPAWFVSLEVLYCAGLAGVGWVAFGVCRRLRTPRARFAVLTALPLVLVAAGVTYKAWAFGVAHISLDHWEVWFGPLARLDAFAFGMLLAVLVAAAGGDTPISSLSAWCVRVGGLCLLFSAFLTRQPGSFGDVFFHTWAGLAGVLVIAPSVLTSRPTAWERALSVRPLVLLGVVSYSVFLWHEPLMHWLSGRGVLFSGAGTFAVSVVLLVAAAAVVGGLSYVLLEYPDQLSRREAADPRPA